MRKEAFVIITIWYPSECLREICRTTQNSS